MYNQYKKQPQSTRSNQQRQQNQQPPQKPAMVVEFERLANKGFQDELSKYFWTSASRFSVKASVNILVQTKYPLKRLEQATHIGRQLPIPIADLQKDDEAMELCLKNFIHMFTEHAADRILQTMAFHVFRWQPMRSVQELNRIISICFPKTKYVITGSEPTIPLGLLDRPCMVEKNCPPFTVFLVLEDGVLGTYQYSPLSMGLKQIPEKQEIEVSLQMIHQVKWTQTMIHIGLFYDLHDKKMDQYFVEEDGKE